MLYYSNESEPSVNENSGTSGSSTNTVIFNPHKSSVEHKNHSTSPMINHSYNSSMSPPMNTWNPVIDRLMGNNAKQQLRNESYYKVSCK